jgi:hypothetical protein
MSHADGSVDEEAPVQVFARSMVPCHAQASARVSVDLLLSFWNRRYLITGHAGHFRDALNTCADQGDTGQSALSRIPGGPYESRVRMSIDSDHP